jgi:UDP-N-acetylmuramate dehydrogenase
MQRHPTGYSAGSFFKNPPGCSAGKLIEECGLKGLRVGDAEVSRKHANYIINLGQARASDVITLARKIKRIVRNKKDIILKEEVKILN